ncbi:MAG: phosphoglucosamine mutase, partial [Oscillospiraceae bacterium]|nr:phosphoglucosamine mutase [Oscillospiraceae bacterium]
LLTAIKLMQVMLSKKMPLSKLAEPVTIYPQVLKNVRVDDKEGTLYDDEVRMTVKTVEEKLGTNGRVLLRASGTEPVLRVMAEAPTHEECEAAVDEIIAAMERKGHLINV